MAADRTLTWFFENVDRDGTEQGPAYYIEADYNPTMGVQKEMAAYVPAIGDLVLRVARKLGVIR